MNETDECLVSFKKKVCEFCSPMPWCLKKGDKEIIKCPKFAIFKIHGTGEVPINYFGTGK